MYTMTKVNAAIRPHLTRLFEEVRRVDVCIDSVLEGQAGGDIRIFVDSLTNPSSAQINQGSFAYFAGDSAGPSAEQWLVELPAHCYIMPSSPGWVQRARSIHGGKLIRGERYLFSPESLRPGPLKELAEHPDYIVEKITPELARDMFRDPLQHYHFVNYDTAEQFIETGFGYCIRAEGEVAAACTTAMVCRTGVEIGIMTHPDYRKFGLATRVAAAFLLHCLEHNLYPSWDAANLKSKGLAEKLGLIYAGSYEVFSLQD
ncbi:GNAT family N-acetyltransferase [Paenibacillus sp. RC84]|uniref:GNAT family N-acetyltransferase n=1 Tax=Paenibacillus sp. RC84 TaxID=3156252 RepID=UPI0035118054